MPGPVPGTSTAPPGEGVSVARAVRAAMASSVMRVSVPGMLLSAGTGSGPDGR
jgi:hypothetical protein